MLVSKKIKKVMLLFPTGKVLKGHFQRCELPMGIAYLAAALKNDFEIKVIDGRAKFTSYVPNSSKWEYFGIMPDAILQQVKDYAPDVVGVSCLSSFHFPEVLQLCKMIKKLDKNIITVTGGTHPSFFASRIMNDYRDIDFIVLGEGEDTFKNLLLDISSGRHYDYLDGLAYRDNGSFKINPKTKFIVDLDMLPYPALEFFPLDFYAKKGVPFSVTFRQRRTAPILTSRGCSAQCVFCASKNYWGRKYRMRSAENVLDEIELLNKKHGFGEVQFIDDNLTLDRKRAQAIFRGIIERKLDVCWNTPNGVAVWTLDEELLTLMKKSGCYELTVAFESGDQQVLDKIIKKPLNLKKAQELVKKMKELGIQVHSFFISGFPGETKEQIKRTFDFAWKMDLDSAWFFVANPTPGSELYFKCLEEGYLDKDFGFEEIEYGLAHINTKEFSSKDVEKMVIIQFNIYNIAQLFRHPARFLKKYFLLILTHPIMIIRSLWTDVKKIFFK